MAGSVVTLTGNVTREPELRFTQSGAAVLSFGLAVNRRWRTDDGWQESSSFFDVKAWGELAENAGITLAKGTRVVVTGRMEQEVWTDKETEKNRSKVVVVADEIGCSLRWATATVTKTPKAQPAGVAASNGVGAPAEEPF